MALSLWRWNKSIPRYIVYTATRNNKQLYFTFIYNKDNCKYVHFRFDHDQEKTVKCKNLLKFEKRFLLWNIF